MSFGGVFWEIGDFESFLELGLIGQELFSLLQDTRQAEKRMLEHLQQTACWLGQQISVEGCRAVGLAEDLIQEMVHGAELPFTDLPDAPSHARPYSGMFVTAQALLEAVREFLRILELGKLLPVSALPFIESPTTMITKPSEFEIGG